MRRPIRATQQSTGGSIGARVLDLRGLGPARTLVLVDNKRFVASTSQGTIDTNLIPSILIDRVDIVTGGASAAYGSDAVAGVVNFLLNDKLEGMRTNVQYGESAQKDDREHQRFPRGRHADRGWSRPLRVGRRVLEGRRPGRLLHAQLVRLVGAESR